MTRQGKYQRGAGSESVWIYEPFCIRHRGRSDQRNFPQMYGPPHDCKGKVRSEEISLRKCIRPWMEVNSPGHDELRACLSL